MSLGKIVLWLVLIFVALVVASAVVSAVFATLAFVWWLLQTAVTLAVVGALLYGAYRLYRFLSGGKSKPSQAGSIPASTSRARTTAEPTRPEDRVDDLQQRYANGELSEAELERQLERELDDGGLDSIDRELERERRR